MPHIASALKERGSLNRNFSSGFIAHVNDLMLNTRKKEERVMIFQIFSLMFVNGNVLSDILEGNKHCVS